jgi:hypothetical protein
MDLHLVNRPLILWFSNTCDFMAGKNGGFKLRHMMLRLACSFQCDYKHLSFQRNNNGGRKTAAVVVDCRNIL